MPRDRFQPMAIIQVLDAHREAIKRQKDDCSNPIEAARLDGVLVGLIWSRVEIMALAYAPDRYAE